MSKPVIQYYDELAGAYDQDRFGNSYGAYVDRLERRLLQSWLDGTPAQQTLDFGCGTGRLLDFAHTGVDGSANMLAVAAKKYPSHRLVCADLTRLPSCIGLHRAGLCFHVLMHLGEHEVQAFLAQAALCMQPGGRLIVDIPSATRRALVSRKASGWHGDTAATPVQLAQWASPHWRVRRWRGLMFFPIHRLPPRLRPGLLRLDEWLGASILGRLSSYLVIELERLA